MRVFSNFAVSLDGRIADRGAPSKPLGTPLDRKTMQTIRKMCDVVVVGAGTLRAHPHSMKLTGRLPSHRKQPANVIVSGNADFDPTWDFWKDDSVVRIVFTTQHSLAKAVEASRDRALVFAAGQGKKVEMPKVFEKLKALGFKNVLVEGGGELMSDVMAAGLLQELYVTLTPWILGGRHNPSMVMGDETLWTRLELKKQRKLGQEIYLHYRVKGARRV
ncbi:MAG: dihydrofolate reductase family protein [Bdellovibrionota bacterium]